LEKIFKNISLELPKPVREQISQNIRQAILRGDFKAGDRLVETELANVLGVSRTPVREALRMLENEGLVRRGGRGGGVEVVGFSIEDIIEFYVIREALEVQASEFSIKRITREELDELYHLVDLSEEQLSDKDPSVLFETMKKFNHILLCSCRMPRLIGMIRDCHEYLEYLRKRTLITFERREKAVREHRKIVKAIEEEDVDLTESLIRDHLRGALKAYLAGLSSVSREEKERAVSEIS
jgi:DNA-binding GntR family transcriptional regulator